MTQPAAFTAPVEPDVSQALAFFSALFPDSSGALLHFRGVPEPKDGRPAKNLHYALDKDFPATLKGFLDWCNIDQRAAYVLPAIVRPGGTGKADVLSLPCILIDFDKGNPDANLKAVETLIGPATLIIESGGATDRGPKLHAYWRLTVPATAEDINVACAVRETLALRFDGDSAFKQAAQVIRIPGSIHFKDQPKAVKLRAVRPAATVELSRVSETLKLSQECIQTSDKPASDNTNVINFFDFNNVKLDGSDTDRALTQPIHEGGVDDMTRFEGAGKAIGHFIRMVREGRYDIAGAWEATKGWNQATLVPPWSEERIRTDFDRLVSLDIQARGPLIAAAPALATQQAAGWAVTDWRADRFTGPAPERLWLVEGLVPLATPGLFAAVGDAGKSMLALRLALFISSYPAPDPVLDNGPRFFGQSVTARGAAVILTAEDDKDEVHRRLNGLDPTNAREGRPLFVVPMISAGGTRAILVDGFSGPEPTPFWYELRTQLLAIPDLKLVVLDPLSSFVGADINKDNLAGAALMTMLAELAATTGAAIMLVHHFNKGLTPTSLSDARSSIRGAGALVDNGRWALVMWEADKDDAAKVLKTLGQKERASESSVVYFGGLAKGNAPGAKILRTLVRGPAGVLDDVTDALQAAAPTNDELQDTIYRALCAHDKETPRWCFPIGRASIDKYLGHAFEKANVVASPRRIEETLKTLRTTGRISERIGKAGYYEVIHP